MTAREAQRQWTRLFAAALTGLCANSNLDVENMTEVFLARLAAEIADSALHELEVNIAEVAAAAALKENSE